MNLVEDYVNLIKPVKDLKSIDKVFTVIDCIWIFLYTTAGLGGMVVGYCILQYAWRFKNVSKEIKYAVVMVYCTTIIVTCLLVIISYAGVM